MNINTVTNIFGTIAGVPQVLIGITLVQDKSTLADGIAKISEGVGLFVMAYFIGKPNAPTA